MPAGVAARLEDQLVHADVRVIQRLEDHAPFAGFVLRGVLVDQAVMPGNKVRDGNARAARRVRRRTNVRGRGQGDHADGRRNLFEWSHDKPSLSKFVEWWTWTPCARLAASAMTALNSPSTRSRNIA